MSLLRARPWKEGEDRSRMTVSIAVVEMVGLRIVIVDGEFDQPQAENPCVEVQIPLRVAGYRCNMVNPQNFFAHGHFQSFENRSAWKPPVMVEAGLAMGPAFARKSSQSKEYKPGPSRRRTRFKTR